MFTLNREDIFKAFSNRVATRHYDGTRKISAEDFHFILELGRLSPSSIGSEPWRFVVIQNPSLREQLKPVSWGMQSQIDDASPLVVILAKKAARYDSEFIRNVIARRGFIGEDAIPVIEKYKQFQENDINILTSERSLFDWSSKQTYIALANMMTGAAMIGIDSCPIEGFNYAAVNHILAKNNIIDPNEWGVSVMVTFGYRAREIKPKSRLPYDTVVQWIE